ncbi:hypothetical protein HEB94_006861 [Actinopolymorpha pittospori]|uniref:Tn3 transposase DDE domain-containing protein n=1 Tax=Actinopolymorpha pittospori TaxID=648752 RepID=A0A927N2Z8_9ACTN|nr:hypothetical protein [Actinopolymorpha pittospori]
MPAGPGDRWGNLGESLTPFQILDYARLAGDMAALYVWRESGWSLSVHRGWSHAALLPMARSWSAAVRRLSGAVTGTLVRSSGARDRPADQSGHDEGLPQRRCWREAFGFLGLRLRSGVGPRRELAQECLLASVDGLRFVVPVRTVNAAPSPKYFGFKRGITWLNAVNGQVAGIGQMVVPGTPRDSPHILDALLNLDGGVTPEMVATDNASYSDMVFGLFKILGYNFSPRFRGLDGQRFWRAILPGVETSTYGRAGGPGPQPRQPEQDDHALAGHAEGRGLPGHQPGQGDLLRMLGRENRRRGECSPRGPLQSRAHTS